MTDQERERAEIEGNALADVVIPRLRGEIWRASATWSGIAAFVLLCVYRSDFAALREDLKQIRGAAVPVGQMQKQEVTVQQAEGMLERETRRLIEERKSNGVMRGTGGNYFGTAGGTDR